ncbi:hypothetical protein UFOVP228_44 [uncultured Caudovirales phage]|uniref:Peptidase M28 n=1 Tax=uncultured Caudovirales phage TaxID=2100421 RepID=A0A6J5T8H3_9CAUD|nr:hypothetical protein UFOVP47_58 [uncultured Caudovirales phage]CAB5219239.1 hypothetical protein UFOVP228_44 [uncultured Caudovirales phage]
MIDKTTPIPVAYASVFPPLKPYVKPVYPHAHLPMLTDDDVPATQLMYNLHRALRTMRAHGSKAEAKYVAWLVNRLPVTMIDGAGNIHVDMRTGPMHRTMFTAHTDTVHRRGGPNSIRLDTTNPKATLWRADEGKALGADDGAGIALMQHMIASGVPALYVFFREEESGGRGSSWLAANMPAVLSDVDRCISFDRAGWHDVITHQGMGRCCSDEFANALATALTPDDFSLQYLPDDTGVFTDSANMTDLVGECTNVSVGYKHQHGDGEYQDVTFLAALADQLVKVQWDDLPVRRKAGEVEDVFGFGKWAGRTSPGLPIVPLDQDDQYLIDALYAASKGDYACIRGIVSEWINPEKPEESLRLIDPMRVWEHEYETYANELEAGTVFYAEVLENLADDLITN